MPPLNLVGDFGGGGMLLAFGVVCGVVEARTSGQGQVVDAAMVDGAAVLTTFIHGMIAMGSWKDERGTNLLDTGAPFYDVYESADGKYVSVGAIEPQFYAELLEQTGLADDAELPHQNDKAQWPAAEGALRRGLRARRPVTSGRAIFEGTDVCVAPVLSLGEAPTHPHNVGRGDLRRARRHRAAGARARGSRGPPGEIQRPPRPRRPAHRRGAAPSGALDADRIAKLRGSRRHRLSRAEPVAPGRGSIGRR